MRTNLPKFIKQDALINPRQSMIQSINQALLHLGNPNSPAVITLYSSRGGGKTFLIEAIRTEFEKEGGVHLFGIFDAAQLPYRQLIQSIRKEMDITSSDIPRLVLIDNIDALLSSGDGSAFFEVERELILNLVKWGDTLVVLTSRFELQQWAEGEVMYSQENWRIPPYTMEELMAILNGSELDAEEVYAATFGHPQMVNQVCASPRLTKEQVAEYAYAYFLEGVTEELRKVVSAASLMPAFNVLNLRMALGKNEDSSEDMLAKYYEQIDNLQRQGLIQWTLDVGAYRFTYSLIRRLLARRSRFLFSQTPDLFQRYKEIQTRLAAYFQEGARSTAYLHQYLVSAVFHLAQAHSDLEQGEAAAACLEWVVGNKPIWLGAPWERVLPAWQNGAGEPDVRDDIIEAIGHEGFDQITRQLDEYQRLSTNL